MEKLADKQDINGDGKVVRRIFGIFKQRLYIRCAPGD